MKIVLRLALAVAAVFTVWDAHAQTAPAPAVAPLAKPDPARDAFLAMPLADRKAAQDALVWVGLYNGVDDGAYGKRTLDAIQGFQKKSGLKPDGVLTPELFAALETAADKPRIASGFDVFDDPATGVRLSAPMRVLDKRQSERGHARLANKDASITLDLFALDKGETLESLYKLLATETAARRVEYKAMKANTFFVVSGEDNGVKFYLRYAAGPAGALRGFEFRYPKAKSEAVDRVALAIANSFEPYPESAAPQPSPVASATLAGPRPTPVASATPPPTPAPVKPPGRAFVANAFVVAPGQAITALSPGECANPAVAGKPASFGRVDAATGLARLDGDFAVEAGPARVSVDGADALLLSRAPAAADKTVLEASRGDWTSAGGPRASVVIAALASARGAPLFNAHGDLIGLMGPAAAAPRKVAGATIAEPRPAIAGDALKAFVGDGTADQAAAMSASEIARRFGPRVVGVTCDS